MYLQWGFLNDYYKVILLYIFAVHYLLEICSSITDPITEMGVVDAFDPGICDLMNVLLTRKLLYLNTIVFLQNEKNRCNPPLDVVTFACK